MMGPWQRLYLPTEIRQNAEDVWKELPNSKAASAYVQAYRIASNVIQTKGNYKFLAQVGASIVGSETISNLPQMVLNEVIRR
jgi:hypothetical protein